MSTIHAWSQNHDIYVVLSNNVILTIDSWFGVT